MKLLATLTLIIIIFQSALALAHPPNAIHANYDMVRGQLDVIVQHPVINKWKHFVKEVVVYKNGRKVLSQKFEFQTSFRSLTIPPISISAIDGDQFRIVAICNTEGRGEKTLTVGVEERAAPSGPIEHDIEK